MSETFEAEVLAKLSSIEERLVTIEDKFDDATSFAEGLMEGDGSIFGTEGLNSVKETLSAFLAPQFLDETDSANAVENMGVGDPNSLDELVGSLKDFKDRLSGIKEAIADLPEGSTDVVDKHRQ